MVQIYHASLPFTEQRGLVVIAETVWLKENNYLVNKQYCLGQWQFLTLPLPFSEDAKIQSEYRISGSKHG